MKLTLFGTTSTESTDVLFTVVLLPEEAVVVDDVDVTEMELIVVVVLAMYVDERL